MLSYARSEPPPTIASAADVVLLHEQPAKGKTPGRRIQFRGSALGFFITRRQTCTLCCTCIAGEGSCSPHDLQPVLSRFAFTNLRLSCFLSQNSSVNVAEVVRSCEPITIFEASPRAYITEGV